LHNLSELLEILTSIFGGESSLH